MSRCDAIRALVEAADIAELPAVIGELARGQAASLARLAASPPSGPPTPGEVAAETLLDVDEAARRLGVSASWMYRHARNLPFTRKLGHRTLRFDANGIDRWLRSRARTRTAG